MRGRLLHGKTIWKVHQWRGSLGDHCAPVTTCEAIEFTDGTVLRFMVHEGDGCYGVEAVYPARAITDVEGLLPALRRAVAGRTRRPRP